MVEDIQEDTGRVASDRALVSDGAPADRHPSGFDPSRVRLSGFEVQILTALAQAYPDHYWPFAKIAAVSTVPTMHVRRITRLLKRKGLTRFANGLTTDDGDMAGAGYQITEEGRMLCCA